jgi:molybdopterin-containing oxidoreductase family molybdopterin binding subunit
VEPVTGRRDTSDFFISQIRQPVTQPLGQCRTWLEVLQDLAERAGFGQDYYLTANASLKLKEPYLLSYSREEILDIWAKSWFGPDHDLAWFKKHGLMVQKKKVEEKYPRAFISARIPIYFEHFQRAGQRLKELTSQLGIAWDTSDYHPLPKWAPCPDYCQEHDEDRLYAVNYKIPFHTFTYTAENPWLAELAQHHPYAYRVLIGGKAARRRGIASGDEVWVESSVGRVKGQAKVTECIHPEVVGIAGTFGHWSSGMPVSKDKGLHFNSLLPSGIERIDMVSAALDACVAVKVYKV